MPPMLVDVSENAIIIRGTSQKLRPNQISQINFWGFAKGPEKNSYKLSSEKIDSILLKLLKYFDSEKISYSLSPSCQSYLSKL